MLRTVTAVLLTTSVQGSFFRRFFRKDTPCPPACEADPDCVCIQALFKDDDFDEDAETLYAEATGNDRVVEAATDSPLPCDGTSCPECSAECLELERRRRKYETSNLIGSGARRFSESAVTRNFEHVGAMAELEALVKIQAAEAAALEALRAAEAAEAAGALEAERAARKAAADAAAANAQRIFATESARLRGILVQPFESKIFNAEVEQILQTPPEPEEKPEFPVAERVELCHFSLDPFVCALLRASDRVLAIPEDNAQETVELENAGDHRLSGLHGRARKNMLKRLRKLAQRKNAFEQSKKRGEQEERLQMGLVDYDAEVPAVEEAPAVESPPVEAARSTVDTPADFLIRFGDYDSEEDESVSRKRKVEFPEDDGHHLQRPALERQVADSTNQLSFLFENSSSSPRFYAYWSMADPLSPFSPQEEPCFWETAVESPVEAAIAMEDDPNPFEEEDPHGFPTSAYGPVDYEASSRDIRHLNAIAMDRDRVVATRRRETMVPEGMQMPDGRAPIGTPSVPIRKPSIRKSKSKAASPQPRGFSALFDRFGRWIG